MLLWGESVENAIKMSSTETKGEEKKEDITDVCEHMFDHFIYKK